MGSVFLPRLDDALSRPAEHPVLALDTAVEPKAPGVGIDSRSAEAPGEGEEEQDDVDGRGAVALDRAMPLGSRKCPLKKCEGGETCRVAVGGLRAPPALDHRHLLVGAHSQSKAGVRCHRLWQRMS